MPALMAEGALFVLAQKTAADFARAGIENPELEARLLLQHVLGLSHAEFILREREGLDELQRQLFLHLAERRLAREPLSYITGEREFWGLPFTVSPEVLIPRPETEFLLEQALIFACEAGVKRVLDLGCGSGVIAVVLALELGCEVWALDCSPNALAVAEINAQRHGVTEYIHFICSDFFAAIPPKLCFDLLVSNPPYVAAPEMARLAPEVRREPRLALYGGKEGLDCIARISREAGGFLRPGAGLFVEIGAEQGRAVSLLFQGEQYEKVRILPDLAGRPRVLAARIQKQQVLLTGPPQTD